MVAPTLSSVTPNYGEFLGGYYLTLTGTNFVLSDDAFDFHYDPLDTDEKYQKVATYNPPVPTPAPVNRMRVELDFGGGKTFECSVEVWSPTKISVRVPKMLATNPSRDPSHSETADIVITPLDALGDPIVGDVLRVAAAFTARLPQYGADSDIDASHTHAIVHRQLIGDLRSYVLANTISLPHQLFEISSDPDTQRAVKSFPALVVVGPETSISRAAGNRFASVILTNSVTGDRRELQAVKTKDFCYDLILVAHSSSHVQKLMAALEKWAQRTEFNFTLFAGTDWETTWLRNLVFDASPSEHPVPTLLADSIHNVRARIRILGLPVGISGSIEHEGLPIMVPAIQSSLIHGPNQPRIIEDT